MSKIKDYLMDICQSCLGSGHIDGYPCPDEACGAQDKYHTKTRRDSVALNFDNRDPQLYFQSASPYPKIPCSHCEQGYQYYWVDACCDGHLCGCGGVDQYMRSECSACGGTQFISLEDVPMVGAA